MCIYIFFLRASLWYSPDRINPPGHMNDPHTCGLHKSGAVNRSQDLVEQTQVLHQRPNTLVGYYFCDFSYLNFISSTFSWYYPEENPEFEKICFFPEVIISLEQDLRHFYLHWLACWILHNSWILLIPSLNLVL